MLAGSDRNERVNAKERKGKINAFDPKYRKMQRKMQRIRIQKIEEQESFRGVEIELRIVYLASNCMFVMQIFISSYKVHYPRSKK